MFATKTSAQIGESIANLLLKKTASIYESIARVDETLSGFRQSEKHPCSAGMVSTGYVFIFFFTLTDLSLTKHKMLLTNAK